MLFRILFVLCCLFATSSCTNTGSSKEHIQKVLQLADVHINGNRPWDINVHDDRLYNRIIHEGSLGLGEAYMDGWWDSTSPDQTIAKIMSANLEQKVDLSWRAKISYLFYYLEACFCNLQNKVRSMKVIDQHYQLGNDLYKKMLGRSMAYSCGYWENAENLTEAQEGKFDIICRKLDFKPGMTVLDIGCGWGGFEKYAAEHYGVKVVGVTLSKNQAEYGQKLCEGLPVEIRVQDYRDVEGEFDRVLEIGMFEHVGEKNYRTFMETVHRLLKPGGLFMLHTIGKNDSNNVTDPWIAKYIFPNSQLPSIAQIGNSIEHLFVMEDWHNFGQYYDKTLMNWFDNFDKSYDSLKHRYDSRFYRMWKYYLLSCAGGFRSRTLQLWQVVLSKGGVQGGYQSIR